MALTNEKLTIVGAAGMIGSNMAQTALMMGLTSEICLYDVFSPEGVADTAVFVPAAEIAVAVVFPAALAEGVVLRSCDRSAVAVAAADTVGIVIGTFIDACVNIGACLSFFRLFHCSDDTCFNCDALSSVFQHKTAVCPHNFDKCGGNRCRHFEGFRVIFAYINCSFFLEIHRLAFRSVVLSDKHACSSGAGVVAGSIGADGNTSEEINLYNIGKRGIAENAVCYQSGIDTFIVRHERGSIQ